ncbi:MAG: long-chain fatty acid--CoA ligase [Desulfohalobiaceae bacterium]|nr:long-chain fatty acid--CoA ligase [Desulfohalobiaceae bacterium]
MGKAILDGFPSTSGDGYQLNTITFLRHAARTFPEQEVVSRGIDGNIRRSDYARTYARVKQMANALTELGVQAGDRVGVMGWNTHRFFELYFAVSGIGAVLLQLNPRIAPEHLTHVIRHSRGKYICVAETMAPVIENVAPNLEEVKGYIVLTDSAIGDVKSKLAPKYGYEELLKAAQPDLEWPMVNEHSAYSACYTTGTTGLPKGVYYSHRCIYLHSLQFASMGQINMNDVIMQIVPMFHAQGWGVFFIAPLVGAKLVLPGRYSLEEPGSLVDLMVSEKATVSCGAPAIFMPMLQHIQKMAEKPDLSGLRMFSGATEPPVSMMKGYWDLGKAQLIHAYGATETTPLVTMNKLKPSLENLPEEEQWELRKKQGLPVAGIDVKIVDPMGNVLPHDGKSVGELWIKGPWITTAYYDDERSDESFQDGYWKSSDVATIDENGYVKVTDRLKDVIKSGGEWISSIDLENSLMGHPQVLEAAVVGIEHPKWAERPLALVVLSKEGQDAVSKADIYAFLQEKFPKWQLPDDILFVDKIPKTSVGKFSKKDIRETYKDYYSQAR